MATRQVVQWEPMPGRSADVVANMADARKIHERLGYRVRAWQTLAAGATGPRISYVLESDNIAAFFTTMEKLRNDAGWAAFAQRVLNSPTPSARQIASTVGTEIPGLESGPLNAAPGSMIASVFQHQVKPGRRDDAIASWLEAKPVANGMGATLSVSTTNYAGAGAGIISTVFLFNNIGEMVTFQEKAATNAAWHALLQRGQAADGPSTIVSSALLAEIPI